MIEYRRLSEEEICRPLFAGFIRRQVVQDCWRREAGEWVVRADPFIDDWSGEEYDELVRCLKHTVATGGFVYAAFVDEVLKGFVSVEAGVFGGEQRYLDLTSIHVSQDLRGQGVGARLFAAAKEWARSQGGGKLDQAVYFGPFSGGDAGVLPGDGLCGGPGVRSASCGKRAV